MQHDGRCGLPGARAHVMIVHEHLNKVDVLRIANGLADLGGFKARKAKPLLLSTPLVSRSTGCEEAEVCGESIVRWQQWATG